MTEQVSNNKRIAKNTIYLYIRMLATMFIALYTSRVILNVLGVDDFGIQNVVGGIISMFSFINGGMSAATSRYLTYDIGKGDFEQLKKTFGVTLFIHFVLAGIIFLLAETVGLWFLYNKLIIPESRMHAAFWVYQCSIIGSLISIICVPYNASIIAHEKMSAFAWITISDVIFKLLIVYLLLIFPFDKLIVYAILTLLTQVFNRLIYRWYCYKHFKETHTLPKWDKMLFVELFSFAGWNMYGNISIFAYSQGLNLLLNMFFGPTINAARGVAYQVQGIASRFISNFQMAINPQITKNFAVGDFEKVNSLIITSTKMSFFLVCLILVPLIFEAPYVLRLWLKIVPDHTVQFFRLIVCISVIDTFVNPITIAASATGVKNGAVRKFQFIIGTIFILILPISYYVLKLGAPAVSVFIVHLIVAIIALCVRLALIKSYIGLSIKRYIKHLVFPCFVTISISLCSGLLLYNCWGEERISELLLFLLTISITTIIGIFLLGLNKAERLMVKNKIRKIIKK